MIAGARVVLLLALAAAQADGQRPAGREPAAARFNATDRALYARILAMADARVLDTSVVDQALVSRSAVVRGAGALAVGQIGRGAAGPRIGRLRGSLVDPEPYVAARAAYALGLLRDALSVADLARATRDRRQCRVEGESVIPGALPSIAVEATWALGQIGEPAREVIVERLRCMPLHPAVTIQLLLAAAKLRPVPVEAVVEYFRAREASVVWAAAYAIARPRASAGVRALVELASSTMARPGGGEVPAADASPAGWYSLGASAPARIRAEIARGLAQQTAGDSLADLALGALTSLAADAHPHVRVNALRSIATYERRGLELLRSAAADPDSNVRRVAAEALDTTARSSPPADAAEEKPDTAAGPHPEQWYRDVVERVVAPTLRGQPPIAVINTVHGPIELELFGADAPLTVHNFLSLARRGFYDGLVFHRVVPNFVVQDGDPSGDGNGGPGYSIRDELNPWRYERGVLGMALSGPDTGGSQYFITHSPQPHLDGGYTVFGRIRSGHEALDAIVQGDRIVRVHVR